MKKVLLSVAVLSAFTLKAQTEPSVRQQGAVGINTQEPRATLDVNGDARFQDVKSMSLPASSVNRFTDCPCVLTIDQYGVVHRVPLSSFITTGDGSGSGGDSSGGSGNGDGSGGDSSGGSGSSYPNGSGYAVMDTSQTIYITSIKDGNIDQQGVINNDTNKINFTIPYTSGNNQDYNSVIATVTSNTNAGEEEDVNELKLTINYGTFSSDGGSISGTIEVLGDGVLNVKKQNLPTSTADFESKKLEVANIQFNLGTLTYTLKIVGISGILDRCFGKTTKQCVGYGADEKEHEFIYLPIQGPDGKIWLNNNLGAEYANVNSTHFNPAQQATGKNDWKSYGSLFQWQRNPDGHELINWSSSTSAAPKHAGTSSISHSWTNPNTNLFIPYTDTSSYSWVIDSGNGPYDLWQSGKSNNPCPLGYHVPTHQEQMDLHDAIVGINLGENPSDSNKIWQETSLHLTASGNRYYNSFTDPSFSGYFWSSDRNEDYAWSLWFNSVNSYAANGNNRSEALNIRCIKD
ncbi:hypothetical protein JSO59_008850 [Riemerella anatipestifer]|uniref:FISUMP domain-containing protein n=1 Tax=Riemerella anatipestifer TaxID=34085 RepID=UPI0030C4B442